jgi:hypothetical protein
VRILFDHGVPVPLRHHLPDHEIRTAYELEWSTLRNGELLARAEAQFDALITTDRHLKNQQNLSTLRIAILARSPRCGARATGRKAAIWCSRRWRTRSAWTTPSGACWQLPMTGATSTNTKAF